MELHELMGNISEEHDVFQTLLELDRLIAQAEKLEENFRKNAEKYYTQIMELLSRDEKV